MSTLHGKKQQGKMSVFSRINLLVNAINKKSVLS